MRATVVLILILTLGVACVALYYIHCLEKYLDSPSWNRKRIGWVLMTLCLGVGIYDVVTMARDIVWPDLVFVAVLFSSLGAYTDSYRLLLRTVKRVDAIAAVKK